MAEARTTSGRSRSDRVRSLARDLAAEVASLDSSIGALSGREAAELAVAFSSVSRLAGAGVTLASGRVAATGYYREAGSTTARQWLASATGASAGEAGRTITTAESLEDAALRPTRAALVDGNLTATQAAEVASAGIKEPTSQTRLLGVAATGTAKRLRDECQRVRLAGKPTEDPEARRKRLAGEVRFSTRNLGNGLSELAATMPTSWLVLVVAAVRHQCEAIFAKARAEGREDPHQAYLVEALVTLLLCGDLTGTGYRPEGDDGGGEQPADTDDREIGEPVDDDNDSVDLGTDGRCASVDPFDDPVYAELQAAIRGEPPPARPSLRARRLRRGRCRCGGRLAPRAKIVIRVDQSALHRGWTEGDEVCDVAGVGPVPVTVVRELWPDAVAKLVITNGVDVVNVTHLGRRATDAIETATQWQTGGACSNQGCDNDRFVDLDHRVGWANTHRTRLDELDPLCRSCHHRKSRDNWQLVRGTGRRRFVPPDHPEHPGDPPTPVRRS